jgi:hypothetical protein
MQPELCIRGRCGESSSVHTVLATPCNWMDACTRHSRQSPNDTPRPCAVDRRQIVRSRGPLLADPQVFPLRPCARGTARSISPPCWMGNASRGRPGTPTMLTVRRASLCGKCPPADEARRLGRTSRPVHDITRPRPVNDEPSPRGEYHGLHQHRARHHVNAQRRAIHTGSPIHPQRRRRLLPRSRRWRMPGAPTAHAHRTLPIQDSSRRNLHAVGTTTPLWCARTSRRCRRPSYARSRRDVQADVVREVVPYASGI